MDRSDFAERVMRTRAEQFRHLVQMQDARRGEKDAALRDAVAASAGRWLRELGNEQPGLLRGHSDEGLRGIALQVADVVLAAR